MSVFITALALYLVVFHPAIIKGSPRLNIHSRLEQWLVCFESYDKALALLKAQEIPDDNLRGKLQLGYSEAKKKAKQVRRLHSLFSFLRKIAECH